MEYIDKRIVELEKELAELIKKRLKLISRINSTLETVKSMNADLQALAGESDKLLTSIQARQGGLIELKRLAGNERVTEDKTPKIETI